MCNVWAEDKGEKRGLWCETTKNSINRFSSWNKKKDTATFKRIQFNVFSFSLYKNLKSYPSWKRESRKKRKYTKLKLNEKKPKCSWLHGRKMSKNRIKKCRQSANIRIDFKIFFVTTFFLLFPFFYTHTGKENAWAESIANAMTATDTLF